MEGYVTSIEPGIYIENQYGIRIENLYFTKKVDGKLCFEALTMFPIDIKLILPELLSAQEKQWLNDYHQKVYQTLAPFLRKDEKLWLEKKCRAVMWKKTEILNWCENRLEFFLTFKRFLFKIKSDKEMLYPRFEDLLIGVG